MLAGSETSARRLQSQQQMEELRKTAFFAADFDADAYIASSSLPLAALEAQLREQRGAVAAAMRAALQKHLPSFLAAAADLEAARPLIDAAGGASCLGHAFFPWRIG